MDNSGTSARKRAVACFVFSAVFAVVGALLLSIRAWFRLLEDTPAFLIFFGYVLGFVFLNGAIRALRRGQRHLAPCAAKVLAEDLRPPVLYLRSFKSELAARPVARFPTGIMQAFPDARLEEHIVHFFQRLGPIIALGRPGETLPELGAARLHVEEGEWQSEVVKLISMSQLVIVTAGTSSGLQWEIGKAVELLKPTQILIFFADFESDPDCRELSYQQFRGTVASLIPMELPPNIGDAVFLLFSEAWEPILIHPPAYVPWEKVLARSAARAMEIISPGFKARHAAAQEELSKLSGIARLRYTWAATPKAMRNLWVIVHATMILLFAAIMWFVTLKIFPELLWPLTSVAVLVFTVLYLCSWVWALCKGSKPEDYN